VQPFGAVPPEELRFLVELLSAAFGADTLLLRAVELPPAAHSRLRGQYDADVLLEELFRRLPERCLRLIGVTVDDLYVHGRTFVVGYAHLSDGVAIYSTARLAEERYGRARDLPRQRARVCRAVVHEIGHTFGNPHCDDSECVMRAVTHVESLDALCPWYCPSCHARVRVGLTMPPWSAEGCRRRGMALLRRRAGGARRPALRQRSRRGAAGARRSRGRACGISPRRRAGEHGAAIRGGAAIVGWQLARIWYTSGVADETWTILRVLSWTQGRFAERGLGTPRLDAELLLAHALGRDRVGLYTHFDQPLHGDELAKFRELIKRRLAGEPVAYLVGKKEFRSLELSVDARVLVPRPDTETLVEAALALVGETPRIVDVGTGSGAIALALKAARPGAEVLAVDRSPEAAAVARGNAERLALAVEVLVGDLLAPVAGPFDLIVSNPPYIPSGEIPSLAPEVQREPRLALDGGPDGLEVIRRLIADAPRLLAPLGALAMEVGAGQAPSVLALLARAGFASPSTARDLAGIDRVVTARRPA
jgi:release factor glutamine methyltransferase